MGPTALARESEVTAQFEVRFHPDVKLGLFLRDCNIPCYSPTVIRTFRHRGIEKFFRTGSKAGIQPKHEQRLRILLTALNLASTPTDMNREGWNYHPLKGDLKGHWSVSVSGNWRLTFSFEGEDAILVDYQDYH